MAFRVFIDPGHGGTDPGAVFDGRQEKDDVLNLALAVGRILEDQGIDVVYSRTEDFYDSPYEKAMKGNESEADLFLSLHRNAAVVPGSGTGADMLVYANTGFAADVANQIGEAIANTGFQYNGITERPNLAVLRRTKMPAVLVEAGFIDNENDNLFFDENFDALAQAIAQGVLNTFDQEHGFDSVSVSGSGSPTDFSENSAMNSDMHSAFTDKDPAEIMRDYLPGSSPAESRETFFESNVFDNWNQDSEKDRDGKNDWHNREDRDNRRDWNSRDNWRDRDNRDDWRGRGNQRDWNDRDDWRDGDNQRDRDNRDDWQNRNRRDERRDRDNRDNWHDRNRRGDQHNRNDRDDWRDRNKKDNDNSCISCNPGKDNRNARSGWTDLFSGSDANETFGATENQMPDNTEMTGNPERTNNMGGPGRPSGPESPGRPDRPGRPGDINNRLYRVQVGAFTNPMFATQLLNQLLLEGFPAFIVFSDGLYRVQVGAFSVLENAVRMERRLRNQGYQTFITT